MKPVVYDRAAALEAQRDTLRQVPSITRAIASFTAAERRAQVSTGQPPPPDVRELLRTLEPVSDKLSRIGVEAAIRRTDDVLARQGLEEPR